MTEFRLAADVADAMGSSPRITAELTSGETLLASVKTDRDSTITGEARLPVAELSHFAPSVDLPGCLVRASFRVPGDGTEPTGEVALEGVMAKLSPQVPTISSLTGSLLYADEAIRIDELSGEMGDEPVTLSGAYSFADDEDSPIDIRIAARNALLVRAPGIQLRSDLDVDLTGSSESMRLAGDVDVTEARYTSPVQLFSLGTSAASPSPDLQVFGPDTDWARTLLLDVGVTADRTIVMSNNLFDGTLSADMTIGGNLAVPRPTGRVFTDAGTVRLPTARLQVEELEVRFLAEAAFAPEVYLVASTSIQGYDMNVTVDGQLPSVEVRIVSAPPLPTDEALVLLTTGARSSDLSFAPDVSGTLTAVGTVVGRQILNQLSRQMTEEERGFLERLDFEVERERESGEIGNVGVEYRLGDDENWVLLFDRKEEESYTLQLAWRLWID
ncbi:MAG: translocation/assembly module TamB domain-containing protein, partial [Spirochaetota bacterium]